MVMPALASIGSAVLPQLASGAAGMAGQYLNNRFAANQGQTPIGGDAQGVENFRRSNNLQIDPNQAMQQSTDDAIRQAEAASRLGRGDTLFSAGIGQQQADNAAKRGALLDAQSQAANLAGQQVNAAASRAASNNQLIGAALQSGLMNAGRL